VHFINDVNFVTGGRWSELDVFPQFPDFIYAAVGSAVNFVHIQRRIIGYFNTIRALIAGSGRRPLLTIERFGQNPGDGRFPDAARTAEKKSVRDAPLAYGIAQGFDNMLLTGNFFKILRPEFSG